MRAKVATHDKSVFLVRELAERSQRAVADCLHHAVIARFARSDRERKIIFPVMLIDERSFVAIGAQRFVIDLFNRTVSVRRFYVVVHGVIERRRNHLERTPVGRCPVGHLHRRRAAGRLAPIQILLARIGIAKRAEIERTHPARIDDSAVQRINLFPCGSIAYGKI